MEEKHLIIDITNKGVNASVCLDSTFEEVGSYSLDTKNKKEALANIVMDIEKDGHGKSLLNVLVSLPGDSFILRETSLPLKDKKKINELLPMHLNDSISDIESYIFKSKTLANGNILAIALKNELLEGYKEIFEDLNLNVKLITASFLYNDFLIADNDKNTSLITNDSFCVSSYGEGAFFKSIRNENDLKMAIAYFENKNKSIDNFYVPQNILPEFKTLGLNLEEKEIKNPDISVMNIIASKGIKDFINFQATTIGDTKFLRQNVHHLKYVNVMLVLATTFLILFSAVSFLNSRKEIVSINKNLEILYKRYFNKVKVDDPILKLEIQLSELAKDKAYDGKGAKVLKVLQRLTEGGKDKVSITNFSIDEALVTIKGEAGTIENANNFKSNVETYGEFSNVKLMDVKNKARTMEVTFTLSGEII